MDATLINKEGYKFGLINGILGIALLYGSWAMGTNTFITVQIYSMFIPYMIAILLIAGFQLRKNNGGYLGFRDGLRFAFLSYVISSVLIAIATYILYNVIDKDLTERSFVATLENTRHMMEKMGVSEDKIEQAMSEATKKKAETTVKTIILGLGLELVWGFVKSLAVTFIIRKEKPVTFEL